MRALVPLACLMLDACASQSPAPPTPPPAVAAATCPPVVSYSNVEEAAQADALDALKGRDPNSPLIGLIIDYGHMRAAARACVAAQ
jgi:hypothetical protein